MCDQANLIRNSRLTQTPAYLHALGSLNFQNYVKNGNAKKTRQAYNSSFEHKFTK